VCLVDTSRKGGWTDVRSMKWLGAKSASVFGAPSSSSFFLFDTT
jgi:hypothetical protein